MGIKNIYPELGTCRRVALSKLASDCLESEKRPYRIAIDIAIWQFQNQAAKGGTNPAIRTLFYRLVRLLATPVQPIFVFDGPFKPAIKRNKKSGRGDGYAIAMAKRLIRLFGFAVHDAPGEAEAECAFIQRHGIVDAVLSEDVDTIMFGCTKTLRNWSTEGKNGAPTHVSLYDVYDMNLADRGLDREGMVLVALMSGGDYLPDGIPGCGVKVACEAAKAGFGTSLCRLKASDETGVQKWRKSLQHELRTNEQRLFRTKHPKLVIPDDFPNLEVLGYYTHPVVSPTSSLPEIRQKIEQRVDIQLKALRDFTRETFDWDYRIGAIKFVRVLGQALLVHNITEDSAGSAQHIKRISGRRTHFSTDGTPELRITYVPEEVVPVDMTKEVDEVIKHGRTGLALNSDEEFDTPEAAGDTLKIFDITKPDLAWVLEGLVKISAPAAFQEWQDKERIKAVRKSTTKKKPGVAKSTKALDMPRGSLDKYVKTTKASASQTLSKLPPHPSSGSLPTSPPRPVARHSPSKQTTSSPASKGLVKSSAVHVTASSPSTPRPFKSSKQPDAIYISSSPPVAAGAGAAAAASAPSPIPSPVSPSLLQPLSDAAPGLSQLDEVPKAMPSISQSNYARTLKGSPRKQPRKTNTTIKSKAPPRSILKQASMELFVTKSKPSVTSGPETAKLSVSEDEEDNNNDSGLFDLEPLSSLTQAASRVKEASIERNTLTQMQGAECNKTGSSFKKKLLRVRTSAAGFYEEVELDAEERDARLVAGGSKATVVRWSDVSLIDLT